MEEPVCHIDEGGNKFWYLPSKGENYWHRLDGPAIEWPDGLKAWYVDDKLHRLDGPAYEWADGTKWWCIDGELHRLDGPAVEYADGPVIEWADGPVIEWADGSKEWWVDGKELPTEEVEAWLEENQVDLKTDEGQLAFKLRWI